LAEFELGDHAAGVPHQIGQQVEGARAQRHRLTGRQQAPFVRLQFEVTGAERRGVVHGERRSGDVHRRRSGVRMTVRPHRPRAVPRMPRLAAGKACLCRLERSASVVHVSTT
jgi:hypothetical protein